MIWRREDTLSHGIFVAATTMLIAAASCILDSTGGKKLDDNPTGSGGAAGSGGFGVGAGNAPGGAGAGGEAGSGGFAECGDGIIAGSEQCDDSGTVDGDGCSATCTYDASDTCGPATAVQLVYGAPLVLTGDTSSAANDLDIACDTDALPGPDVFFAVTPATDGRLRAVASAGFDKSVYLMTDCLAGSYLDCDNDSDSDAYAAQPVTGSTTYIVGIDSRDPGGGPFTLTLELGECGDGVLLQPAEECDDNNLVPGDGCSDTCVHECNADPNAEEAFKTPFTFHCYQLFTTDPADRLTWDAARVACTDLGAGWDLASVPSYFEAYYIDFGAGNGPPNGLPTWIGGNDAATDLTFVWSNADPWPLTPPWNSTSPTVTAGNTDDCVALVGVMNADDEWDDTTCTTPASYLCERAPPGR